MSDFDFIDDVAGEVDPNESFGFTELPSGWHEFTMEVLEVERKKTRDGDGTVVRVTARVCEKKYASNRAWGTYFVDTDNEEKREGAKIGAINYAKLINACGFVFPKGMSEEVEKLIQIGLMEKFDKNTFKDQKLVGRFFRGNVYVKEKQNEDEQIYPELRGAKMIDPEDYQDVVKEAKETKREKKAKPETDEPPF